MPEYLILSPELFKNEELKKELELAYHGIIIKEYKELPGEGWALIKKPNETPELIK